MIKFNIPHNSGKEVDYLIDSIRKGRLSGNGKYTKLCQNFFEKKFHINKTFLTTSCTDALEMSAILSNIKDGDEIIMPTYTFVSTANAFILRGAKIKFIDSKEYHPNLDENLIENQISQKTKAIVVVHYAGVACDMNKIKSIAKKYNLLVVEDAAQSINSFYKGIPLGSIGDFGCFSFHETKNIQCGEGGLIAVNNINYKNRAEVIWEKGTNRNAFLEGSVDKYSWIDVGSSFLPSELTSTFLYAQLENLHIIQRKRLKLWEIYNKNLNSLKRIGVELPLIPSYATNNAHIFYLIARDPNERINLISYLRSKKIIATFHYVCLHDSPFFDYNSEIDEFIHSKKYETCLVRLPLYPDLNTEDLNYIVDHVLKFYNLK